MGIFDLVRVFLFEKLDVIAVQRTTGPIPVADEFDELATVVGRRLRRKGVEKKFGETLPGVVGRQAIVVPQKPGSGVEIAEIGSGNAVDHPGPRIRFDHPEQVESRLRLVAERFIHPHPVDADPGLVKEVVKAKERGLSISMGSTPHHALLNSDDARDAERGLKMNPPLRAESDRLFIYESLKNGVIDNVESDHAPHTLDDKRKGASGIPCFSGMLLLYHKLKEDGVSRERLLDLFGRNVIKIYGLRDEEVRLPDDSEELFSKVSSAYPIRPFKWS